MMTKNKGFSLIEIMVALAIMGVLAAIAVPSYNNYTRTANMKAAQQFMYQIANQEEQYLLDARTYTATIGAGGLGLTEPQELAGKYTFAVAIGAIPPTYTITATPVGGMAGTSTFTLDSTGVKAPAGEW